MSSIEWEITSLGEIAEIIMGQSPAGETCNEIGNGIPLLNGPTEFGNSHPNPVQYTTDSKKFSEPGDLLFCVRGSTTGRMNWADQQYAIGRGLAALRHKKGKDYQSFLKGIIDYYLPVLLAEATGSTFPNVSSQQLSLLSIEVPPLPAQRRIAVILSALDEKIELNHQTNTTIEAIAQAIFKEWFVNFNFPGATGEMQGSELGSIPKEWRVGCFQDIINNEIGGDWGKDNSFEGGVPIISLRGTDLEQLKSFGYAPDAPVRWVKESSLEKRKITRRDILIAGSGLGPIGRSIYCPDILQDLYAYPITYSNFCKKLRAETPAHAIYAERLLESIYINGEMKQYFTGTSIPNLDIQSLLAYKIIIPKIKILEEYYKKIGKEKIGFLFNQENIFLTQIRDALLPKMMSGKIEL